MSLALLDTGRVLAWGAAQHGELGDGVDRVEEDRPVDVVGPGGGRLADALDLLEDQHAEMHRRLRSIVDLCGQRNAWNGRGPTEDLPLLVTVIHECQT